jgi:hypothetical protein
MEKEVIIAIIGALAVIGGAVIESGILDHFLGFDEGGGPDSVEDLKYPPTLISLEPDEEGPKEVGSEIKWTAIATDPDGGRLDYKFSVKGSSTDDPWVVGKDWSTQNWWEWIPSEAGSYNVQVEVRDGDHAGPEGRDDSWTKRYVIGMAGFDEAERSREPPILTSLEPDRPGPQETGVAIKWVARAEDPDDESLYYRFLLTGPSTGGSWDAVQDWSTQSWWDWEPSEAGGYRVQVEVRDGDHAGAEGRDDFRISGGYEIEERAVSGEADILDEVKHPPTLISLEPDRRSPREVGSAIRWTARAEDPDDEILYYRFLLTGPSTGESWDAVQDWSPQSWWDWEPSEAGGYRVQVEVRDGDHAGAEGRDDFRISGGYEIEAAPTDAKRVAFIYSSDLSSGESFKSFFDSEGFSTDLISIGRSLRGDYDLIIVGSDAGGASTSIDDQETAIMGVGEGGYTFLGKLGLEIGSPHGWHGSNTDVYIKDNSYSVFRDPNEIPSGDVKLYTKTDHVGIYLPSPPSNVVLIGREVSDEDHYPIVLQDGRYLLWGFTGSPKDMTSEGKRLFVNIADHLATGKAITVSGGPIVYRPNPEASFIGGLLGEGQVYEIKEDDEEDGRIQVLDPEVLSLSKKISTST